MVRVTVNLPEAAAAVPEIKQRMLDAGCTAPLIGDFHYNGHLLLTKFPDCARGARQVPHQPGQRRHRHAPRRTVLDDLQGRGRSRQAGADRRQRRLAEPGARRREDAGEHRPRSRQDVRRDHQRVHGAVGGRVDGARDRERAAQGPDHHLVQDVAAARSDCGLSRAGAADRSAAAPRPHRSGHGDEGARLVGVGDGRAAGRRHRRHDPRLADAAARRRPPRRGLRRVRAAAGARPALVLAERHRLPGLRAHDEHDVPGARRADPGLHPREDAGVEDHDTRASKR